MLDPIDEILWDIFDDLGASHIDSGEFENLLREAGFMIVPIEDPTNLRYGIDE